MRDAYDDEQRAHELHLEAQTRDPLSEVIHANLVVGLFNMDRDNEAEQEARRLIALHPSFGWIRLITSGLRSTHGDLVGGLEELKEYERIDPNAAQWQYRRCNLLLNLDARVVTDSCYQTLLDTRPSDPSALHQSVNWYLARGLNENALQSAETAVEISREGTPGRRLRLAFVNTVVGQNDSAREVFSTVAPGWFTDTEPTMLGRWVNSAVVAAVVLQRNGEKEQAERLLRAALKQMEGMQAAHGGWAYGFSRAGAYAVLGEHDRALDALDVAVNDGARVGWFLLPIHPAFASIRDDERFAKALAQIEADIIGQRQRAEQTGLIAYIQ